MQLIDSPFRRHTDSTDEQRRAAFDDHIQELRKLTISVIAVSLACVSADLR